MNNPSDADVYVDALMNSDSDGEKAHSNLLHCTFRLSRSIFPTRRKCFEIHPVKNTQFQSCSIVLLRLEPHQSEWGRGVDSNGNCLFCHFPLPSSFLIFAFSFCFSKNMKQREEHITSPLCIFSAVDFFAFASFLFGTEATEMSSALHSKSDSSLFMIKHSVLQKAKTTRSSSKQLFSSISLINCITTSERNRGRVENACE